jgi:hypothetical protein
MATEALTAQVVTRTGAQVTRSSVTTADGFTFTNNGRCVFIITEQNAANSEMVFTIQTAVDGQTGLTRTVDVTASQEWCIGPFPVEQYNDSDGLVTCTPEADQASAVAILQI